MTRACSGRPTGQTSRASSGSTGGPGGAQDFTLAANALAERGIGSVALDLPGFGASPAPEVAGGARHYARTDTSRAQGDCGRTARVRRSLLWRNRGRSHRERAPRARFVARPVGAPVLRQRGSARAPIRVSRRSLAREDATSWAKLASNERVRSTDRPTTSEPRESCATCWSRVSMRAMNPSWQRLEMPVTFVVGERDLDVPLAVATSAAELVKGRPRCAN